MIRVRARTENAGVFLRGIQQGIRGGTSASALDRMAQRSAGIIKRAMNRSIDERLNKNPTGRLKRSYQPRIVRSKSGRPSVVLQSRKPYAWIHEAGGVIVGNPSLAIPLTLQSRHIRARDFPGRLHRRGRLLFDASGVKQYVLVTRVRIPARRYITHARNLARAELKAMTGRTLRELVRSLSIRARR